MIKSVSFTLNDKPVTVQVDPDRPLFHVSAESASPDQSQAVLDEYAGLVSYLRSK